MKQQLKDKYPQYNIGWYTYGKIAILDWFDGVTKLEIGRFCSFADNVRILLGGEHRLDWTTTYPFNCLWKGYEDIKGHPATKGNVIIKNDVWVGDGATILSGVTIENGAVVGAGSVVTRCYIRPYSIVAGNPAKEIRTRFKPEVIARLLNIGWWNWKTDRIRKAIPYLQNNVNQFIKMVDLGEL